MWVPNLKNVGQKESRSLERKYKRVLGIRIGAHFMFPGLGLTVKVIEIDRFPHGNSLKIH